MPIDAADIRPLGIIVSATASRETVLAELKARFPVGNGKDARDRIYVNGIIMFRTNGQVVAQNCKIAVDAALRLGRDLGYVVPNISDLGPVG
jgi:hypothetical protein